MVGSAIDIVAKPIEAYSKPKKKAAGNLQSAPPSQDQFSQATSDTSTDDRSVATSVPSSIDSRAMTRAQFKDEYSPFKTAVAGSAAGFGGMLKYFTKGMLDAPLAVTEGFRNAPRLYGGKVYQPGRIDDWKSGGVVAGKNLVHGLAEGFGGLVASPVRGGIAGGPVGVVKGFGVGCLNMSTKVPSGKSFTPFLFFTFTHRRPTIAKLKLTPGT